jgi:uncharacterized membrane protein YdjX (TVP38/TMEM64 family)
VTPPPPSWSRTRLRVALLLAVAAALCALWWTGALAEVAHPERARALLAGSGALGPLLWWGAFACLTPFGLPGAVFLIPASLVWPPAFAIPMCVAGATGAGALAFGLARWIGPETIVARLPERVRRHTHAARERGFRTAFLVRLVLFLFAPAHWALGISGIRFAPFVLGSALGFLPGVTLWVFGVREFASRVERLPAWQAVGLGVALLVGFLAFRTWRRRSQV